MAAPRAARWRRGHARPRRVANRFPGSLEISALTGEGLDALKARIAERFADRFESVQLLLPYDEGGRLAELYALGAPIEERVDGPDGVLVRARLHGISIVNTPGLIDSGYRGELEVTLLNTDREQSFTVEPGMRIAQLVVVPVPGLELVEVDELPASERGVRGFGSSAA